MKALIPPPCNVESFVHFYSAPFFRNYQKANPRGKFRLNHGRLIHSNIVPVKGVNGEWNSQ